MLNIALPTGRLGKQVYRMFEQAGYSCDEYASDNRKLILENPDKGFRFFLVKPADVGVYVEHGAADVGVVGKDILLESTPDVYELSDLGVGKCCLAVAGRSGVTFSPQHVLRVATKYPTVAQSYFDSLGREIELIRLSGSIELAPLIGLSDVIVDIVETGTTLRENNLTVTEEITPISARLIANKASYKFKTQSIDQLTTALEEVSV